MIKHKIFIILIFISLALTACGGAKQTSNLLVLKSYTDPSGIFEMTAPQGWERSYDTQSASATFEDPLTKGGDNPLWVQVIAIAVEGETPDEISDETNAVLEDFIRANIPDETYDIYSTSETKVDRKPALIVDFAKQIEGGYVSGRIVLVVEFGVAVGFVGEAERSVWDAFTPTFTQMLEDFVFLP